LTTNGTAALETRDVAVLTTTQIQQGLSTNQIVAMTTDQVTALTTKQVEALSSKQIAAITTDQVTHLALGTPIVLDLNGNGISTLNIADGVQFDIFGTGQKVNTGWATGGDGLLVLDRNHDGSINGGTELFGEGTNLANGKKATNGYAALAELDANGDGIVNGADGNFGDLMVWVDSDADGVSQETELHSLSSLGITELGLNAQTSTATDNGNLIGLTSNYTTSDGAVHDMADVWFQTSTVVVPVVDVANVPAPAVGLQGPPAKFTVDSAPVVGTTSDQMRAQVGSLVDAMAAFGSAEPASVGVSPGEGPASNQKVTTHATVTGPTMVGMVDAMRQFDTNGQPVLLGSSAASGQVATTLNTTIPRKPDTDILASS
jgi:hypothetical protein